MERLVKVMKKFKYLEVKLNRQTELNKQWQSILTKIKKLENLQIKE